MAVVHQETNTVFIHIPKCAGTSINQWMVRNTGSIEVGLFHHQWHQFAQLYPQYQDAFNFAVVRNPYARCVSQYQYMLRIHRDKVKKRRQQYSRYYLSRSYNTKTHKLHRRNKRAVAFLEQGFKHWLLNPLDTSWYDPPEGFDAKQSLQSDWLGDNTHVMRFENLNRDFDVIRKRLDCDAKLKKINFTDPTDYRDWYDSDTKKLVTKWHQKDLDRFEYSF